MVKNICYVIGAGCALLGVVSLLDVLGVIEMGMTFRIPLPGLTHGLAGFFVAGGCDGAAVYNVGVGLSVEGDEGMPPGQEKFLHGLGLILIDLAAQGIDGDTHGVPPLSCLFQINMI